MAYSKEPSHHSTGLHRRTIKIIKSACCLPGSGVDVGTKISEEAAASIFRTDDAHIKKWNYNNPSEGQQEA